MKAFLLFLVILFSQQTARAWEDCLDRVNFRYDAGALTSYVISKNGCLLRFIVSALQLEKYEVNLCDKDIHILSFSSIDATDGKKLHAGSANCAFPLFGADDEVGEDDPTKFDAARKRIYQIYAEVEKVYGSAGADQLKKVKSFDNPSSELKMGCTKQMIDAYLDRCVYYQEQKPMHVFSDSGDPKDLPPGIHPATILPNKN